MPDILKSRSHRLRLDLWGLALLGFVCLGLISVGYGFGFAFVCRDHLPAAFCQSLSLAVPRVLCALGAVGLVYGLKAEFRTAVQKALRPQINTKGLGLAAIGFALVLLPLGYVTMVLTHLPVGIMVTSWLVGLGLAMLGALWAVFDPQGVAGSDAGRSALTGGSAVLAGALIPDLVLLVQPVWNTTAVTEFTFHSVQAVLTALGHDVIADPETKALGIDTFIVAVGKECSGVEGFALLTTFTLFYCALFWKDLRIARAWLLLPIALILSWCLNVARIATLLLIGRFVSPDLAINGFHSHAGWLAFMTLAMVFMVVTHQITWFRKDAPDPEGAPQARQRTTVPFFQDMTAAMILPFAAFMASSTLVSAIAVVPEVLYPLRMALVCGILGLFAGILRTLPWKWDVLSLASGLACGVLWVLTAPPADTEASALAAALADMSGVVFLGWVLTRVLGTSLIVPVVEELVFRGYLQQRLAGVLPWRSAGMICAIAISAGLFGALHGRFVAAVLAGVLFGLLMWRSGRVTDAIQAHATANAVIAAAAMASGGWHLI